MIERGGSLSTQTEAQEEYHKEYYKKNKKEISVSRKLRYQTDPVYREKVKKKARDRYRKKLKSPDKKIGYTTKSYNGKLLFSVKYVLGVINKSRDFLDVWEKRGDIPEAIFLDSRRWRLYTQHQIDLLDVAIGNYDEGVWTRIQVRDFLNSKWRKEDA